MRDSSAHNTAYWHGGIYTAPRACRIRGRERLPSGRLDLEPPAARKARPGSFQVTPEHIALLDAIGMQWDAREAKWAGAFRRAEEYCAAHGNLLVPVNYKTEDGFCLGDWVRRMRENYACAEKKLTAERIAKLEALGMVWTVPQEG